MLRPTHAYVTIAAALLLNSVPAASAPASAKDSLPLRKPGHWKITTIAASLGMTSIDACIGPEDSIAATTSPGNCTPPAVQHAGDQVIVNVVCTSPEGRETTSTLFTGDFTTWYRGIVKISADPPSAAHPNLGVTLDAKYIGPCR